jgi:hypothetical protein
VVVISFYKKDLFFAAPQDFALQPVDIHHPSKTMAACSLFLIRSFGPSGRPLTAYR